MATEVDTVVFDIDDTLYPESSGFSLHRNGEVVEQFMVEELGFETRTAAKALRDEYFERYHSTVKALSKADEEGALPSGHHFVRESLGEWWAENCDMRKYLTPDRELIEALHSLPLKKVIFTNAPRRYGLAVLDALELRACFEDKFIFGVEDVLPVCKPEAAAFQKVLDAVGSEAARSVMFEDSLKNIRASKALGMRTVFLRGADVPQDSDMAAIDTVLDKAGDLRRRLPGLWEGRFEPQCALGSGVTGDCSLSCEPKDAGKSVL
jgi:putative hydrolase of the HAD superfamily